MRSARHLHVSILSLLIALSATIVARADDEYAEEYDIKARVVRISLINGEVNLKRSGSTDWEKAQLNTPLVESDTLATTDRSRVELQIDARNFVRLGPGSMLRIATLRDDGVALSLVEGTASVRLANFDRDREYFEIDGPKITLAAEAKGTYRVDIAREGRVRLTVRDGGRARVYSDTSGFTLREGRAAEFVFEGQDADWELIAASPPDSWDRWVDDRERYLAQRLRYDTQYYDTYVWGAEDLDAYGNWAYTGDYGWIWRPNITIINNYPNWAPYRYGNWVWCPPYGWTWVGYEAWGWAPYHYGRWVYYNNYWAWCPRSRYYRHRSWWRPALVAFNISFGNSICWYPLSYYHRDPYSRYYRGPDRLTPLGRDELANLRRVNPAYARAVTAVFAQEFGSGVRLRAASATLARRVLDAEPVRDLPVRPAHAATKATGDREDRITVVRPPRVSPVEVPIRITGAADRRPGVPLDEELRRSRVLNGREPRSAAPSDPTAPITVETRPTGAVARPTRSLPAPSDQNANVDNNSEQPVRSRPSQPTIRDDQVSDEVERREQRPATVPPRPPANETSPAERPTRPRQDERPAVSERPADLKRPVRIEPVERPQDVETPSARPEPRQKYEPPPRPEPAQRDDPPRRPEPAPRNDPPTRYEPPPRRDPPPRSDPPPRNDPPPARPERPERPDQRMI